MPSTIQIWATDEDLEKLKMLKKHFEEEQDKEFEGKAYLMSNGTHKRKIRRKRINDAFVYREALNQLWFRTAMKVKDFEERYG